MKKKENSKGGETVQGPVGEDLIKFLNGGFGGSMPGMPGMQVVPIDQLTRFLERNNPFDPSLLQYTIVLPTDGSVSRDAVLRNIGFSQEQYRQFIEFIITLNQNVIERANQLEKPSEVKYSRLINILLKLDKETKEEIRTKAAENNASILQQSLNGYTSPQEGEDSGLNQDIEDINDLVGWIPSVILELGNKFIEGGLSAYLGRTDNFKHYSYLILGELFRNMVALGVDPMAIVLSQASNYLSPSELHGLTQNISPAEWEAAQIRADIISPDLLAILVNVIAGNQEAAIVLIMSTGDSLGGDKNGLENFIKTHVEIIFAMAIKFSRSEVVEFVLESCLSITRTEDSSGRTESLFVYDMKKLMLSLFSALIRGDRDTCLKFLKPTVWKHYIDADKTSIVKFIILRSGDATREVLLNEIFYNKNLQIAKLNLYTELLKNAQSDEEYQQLVAAVSPYIAKYVAEKWEFEHSNKELTPYIMQLGTIHTIIEVSRGFSENFVLKYLHGEGLLTFSLYQDVLDQSKEPPLKQQVKQLFSPYMGDLVEERDKALKGKLLVQEENPDPNREGYTIEEIASAFKTLNEGERIAFIEGVSKEMQGVIDNQGLKNDDKLTLLAVILKKIKALISHKVIDLKDVEDLFAKLANFNGAILIGEDPSKHTNDKGANGKKVTEEGGSSHNSDKGTNDVGGATVGLSSSGDSGKGKTPDLVEGGDDVGSAIMAISSSGDLGEGTTNAAGRSKVVHLPKPNPVVGTTNSGGATTVVSSSSGDSRKGKKGQKEGSSPRKFGTDKGAIGVITVVSPPKVAGEKDIKAHPHGSGGPDGPSGGAVKTSSKAKPTYHKPKPVASIGKQASHKDTVVGKLGGSKEGGGSTKLSPKAKPQAEAKPIVSSQVNDEVLLPPVSTTKGFSYREKLTGEKDTVPSSLALVEETTGELAGGSNTGEDLEGKAVIMPKVEAAFVVTSSISDKEIGGSNSGGGEIDRTITPPFVEAAVVVTSSISDKEDGGKVVQEQIPSALDTGGNAQVVEQNPTMHQGGVAYAYPQQQQYTPYVPYNGPGGVHYSFALPQQQHAPCVPYNGPDGVHYSSAPPQPNAYYLDNYGNPIYYYMPPQGNCDQYSNAMPGYYPPDDGYYGNMNNNTAGSYYGGGGGGGNSGGRRKSGGKDKPGKYAKNHKATVEDENTQKDLKEVTMHIVSSVPIKIVVYTEKQEYEETLQEIQKQLDGEKLHVQVDTTHHFDEKLQNASYVPISQDEYMMPKSPFSGAPIMFAGVEKLNMDPILM